MAKYKADVTLHLTVEFEDDGEKAFDEQAWDAAIDTFGDKSNLLSGEVHKKSITKVD